MPNGVTTPRAHDIVLFGATGYTGKLVFAALAEHGPKNLRLALAGRSESRLRDVRDEIAKDHPRVAEIAIYGVAMDDERALSEIVKKTKVVVTTVGPFAKLGLPLTHACAREGTHYCDITGEPQFVRRSIDDNHARAIETGAKIVHTCGFDSIPFDLGVFVLNKHFEKEKTKLESAKSVVMAMRGKASGGTFASMLNIMEEASRDPQVRRIAGNPYALNPDPSERGPDRNEKMRGGYDEDAEAWVGPFVMAAVNTRVVRRTNALLGFPYGKQFRYQELMRTGRGAKGFVTAWGLAAGLSGFVLTAATGPGRALLGRVLPQAGSGPTPEERTSGFFKVSIFGRGTGEGGAGEKRATAFVEGEQDPGYGETAKMLSEAAFCLAADPLPAGGGVLTPASSMGEFLVERLRSRKMRFDVENT